MGHHEERAPNRHDAVALRPLPRQEALRDASKLPAPAVDRRQLRTAGRGQRRMSTPRPRREASRFGSRQAAPYEADAALRGSAGGTLWRSCEVKGSEKVARQASETASGAWTLLTGITSAIWVQRGEL